MRILSFRLLLILSTTLLLFSCQKLNDDFKPGDGKQKPDTKYNTFKGAQVEVGNGHARSFITISAPPQCNVIKRSRFKCFTMQL